MCANAFSLILISGLSKVSCRIHVNYNIVTKWRLFSNATGQQRSHLSSEERVELTSEVSLTCEVCKDFARKNFAWIY
ncbi:hypothetical protein PDJAM_G00185000 [Pangasius djambal]|uniref:Uncharacterized protein n=1 Tax=Pangasius djambal TaxID=1691987 RepID=A0ACC5Y485_9TELE|nr:hypothetical protein [Pangasius djambal]